MKRLSKLEKENRNPSREVADVLLDKVMLKELFEGIYSEMLEARRDGADVLIIFRKRIKCQNVGRTKR